MRNSFKAVAAALLLSTALASAATFAADAPAAMASTKIAVVNVQNIMRDATAAKSVREQMEAKQKAYQAEIAKKEEALQKEEQELGKQRATLAKDAFEAKVKAFRDKATSAQKDVAGKKASLDAAFEKAIGQIQKTVEGIINDMAKEKGFAIAVPTSQILYAESSMDISAEVLSRLNQKLPRVDVQFSGGAASAPAAAPAEKKK